MSGRRRVTRAILVTTAALAPMLVVAACTINLRGEGSGSSGGSPSSRIANPLGADLERCRKITSEQVAELQACSLIWAENRRRFLGSKKTAQIKEPGPLRQGWAPVATPEQE
jgi:conjugative transfer region protein TrbK